MSCKMSSMLPGLQTRLLEEKGDDVDPFWDGYTPLMVYAANNEKEKVEEICRDPNNAEYVNTIAGWNNSTALHMAVRNGHFDIMKILIGFGADIEMKNDQENTILLVAAKRGYATMVEYLVQNGANIQEINTDKQTALHLSVEVSGNLECSKYLLHACPELLDTKNKFAKTPFLLAAEFGRYEIAKMFLEFKQQKIEQNAEHDQTQMQDELKTFVNQINKGGNSPLMYASKNTSDEAGALIDLLLSYGADLNQKCKKGTTPLMWAVTGSAEIVEKLIKESADINVKSQDNVSAYQKAVEHGREDIIACFEQYKAEKFPIDDYRHDFQKLTMLISTAGFYIEEKPDIHDTQDCKPSELFEEKELDSIIDQFLHTSVPPSAALYSLARSAAKYDFHFVIFIRLIPLLSNPRVLAQLLPSFFKSLYDSRHTMIVCRLVELASALKIAKEAHPIDKIDLDNFIGKIDEMVTECLASDCMNDEKNLQAILNCVFKWSDPHFEDDLVEQAQAFIRGPLEISVRNDVKLLFKTSHVSRYVSKIFWSNLRTTGARKTTRNMKSKEKAKRYVEQTPCQPIGSVSNIRNMVSSLIFYRYSASLMLIGEGLGKLMYIVVMIHLSLELREPNNRSDSKAFIHWAHSQDHHYEELLVICMTLTKVIYEYGQICSDTVIVIPSLQNFRDHYNNTWEVIDSIGLALTLTWLVLSHFNVDNQASETGRAMLAVAVIFFGVRMLQYLSLNESVGKLTIMLFGMLGELISFAIIFLMVCVGFMFCLYVLLPESSSYETLQLTMLTLFGSAFANYDATFTTMSDPKFYELVIIIQVLYILLVAVVLLNLIIARMTAVHDRIDDKAFQMWQYTLARQASEFVLLEERHPTAMLPPPFNIIPAIFFVYHSLYLRLAVRKGRTKHNENPRSPWILDSVAGTVSDRWMGVSMAFVAPLIEYVYFYLDCIRVIIVQKKYDQLTDENDEKRVNVGNRRSSVMNSMASPVTPRRAARRSFVVDKPNNKDATKEGNWTLWDYVAVSPLMYPVYVFMLIRQALSLETQLVVQAREQEMKYFVSYKTKKNTEPLEQVDKDEDHFRVKVLRANNLPRCENARPEVLIRYGNTEYRTSPANSTGKDAMWHKAEVNFGLRGVNLDKIDLEVTILYRNPKTLQDVRIAQKTIEAKLMKKWIANGHFGGNLTLCEMGSLSSEEKADGPNSSQRKEPTIQITFDAHFPSLLNSRNLVDEPESSSSGKTIGDRSLSPSNSVRRIAGRAGGVVGMVLKDRSKAYASVQPESAKRERSNPTFDVNPRGKVLKRTRVMYHLDANLFTRSDMWRIFSKVDALPDSAAEDEEDDDEEETPGGADFNHADQYAKLHHMIHDVRRLVQMQNGDDSNTLSKLPSRRGSGLHRASTYSMHTAHSHPNFHTLTSTQEIDLDEVARLKDENKKLQEEVERLRQNS